MTKKLIYRIESVDLILAKSNPPNLVIDAHGEASSNGWTEPELQPWIYIVPPEDGVYDFDFVASPPRSADNPVITPIQAHHVWESLPDDVRGIRVHTATNSVTAWLRPCTACRLIDFEEAEILFFPGIPPQRLLVVSGQKPYLNMKVLLVPRLHVGMPEYTQVEVVGCNGSIPAFGPYSEMLDVTNLLGSKGIEVVGATRSKKIDVTDARTIERKAGVRASAQ